MRIKMDDNPDFMGALRSAFFVEPDMEFQSVKQREAGEAPKQSVDRDEVLRWVIHCNYVDTSGSFTIPDQIRVKVSSPTVPVLGEGGSPVFFGGFFMNLNDRRSGDGKGYTASFSAESFTFDPAPSSKRPKAQPPEPVGAKAS